MTKEITDLDVCKKLVQLQHSANDRNIHFDLSFKTVKKLLTVKRCYYTDVLFDDTGNLGRSIDRVDTSQGYVNNNVVACTVEINGKKANLTNNEIELLYKKISKFNSK
jgi:hypothetical protein